MQEQVERALEDRRRHLVRHCAASVPPVAFADTAQSPTRSASEPAGSLAADATRVLRDPAHGRDAPRQLPRRGAPLGRADQDRQDAIYCVVDLHAMTVAVRPRRAQPSRPGAPRCSCWRQASIPARCILFVQSHVAAHTELTWLLNCVATFGELRRMTQFKDKGRGPGVRHASVCSTTRCSWSPTSSCTTPTRCRSATTSASTSSSPATSRSGSTTASATRSWSRRRRSPRRRPHHGPAEPDDQDVEVGRLAPGHGAARSTSPQSSPRRSSRPSPTPGPRSGYDRDEKPGVSNLLEIHAAVTGVPSRTSRRVRRVGVRRVQVAVADAVVEALARSRSATTKLEADPAEVDRLLAPGAAKARAQADMVLGRARRSIGLLPHDGA